MLKHIDRLLIVGYFKAYAICLVSLLGLYIVVDLFTNLDEFTHQRPGLVGVLEHIATYYAYQITFIFDKLSEAIVLLAAMFTIAWMQHTNELMPLLSAGVPTRRVVLPVLIGACITLGLTMANQELVIPRIAVQLMTDKDDPDGDKEITVKGAFEPNGIHLEGTSANRKNLVVKPFHCFFPEAVTGNGFHLTAEEACYVPREAGDPRSGGWLLTGVKAPPALEEWDGGHPPILEKIDPGKYFLHVQEVDFDGITRSGKWFNYASTLRLYQELQRPDSTRTATLAVLFHVRVTRPLAGLILVILGLSVILRDHNRNVFLSAGACLVLCALFFAAFFVCKSLGDSDYLYPALAAWLPVLFFGPLAVAMFDAIHT
jgi:lipopolysaccharide export system permease protein